MCVFMGLGLSGIYRTQNQKWSFASSAWLSLLVAVTCGAVAIGRLDFASGGGSCRECSGARTVQRMGLPQ
jgi:hypothetical protein